MATANQTSSVRAEIEHDAREFERLARQIESLKATFVSDRGRKEALRVVSKIAAAVDAARAMAIDLRVSLEKTR